MYYRPFTLLVISLSFISGSIFSQEISFLPSVGMANASGRNQLIGAMGGEVFALENTENGFLKITSYDSNGRRNLNKPLDKLYFNSQSQTKFLIAGREIISIVQARMGNMVNQYLFRFTSNADIIGSPVLIDSARYDLLNDEAYMNALLSSDKKKILLYRLLRDKILDKLVFDFITINLSGDILQKATHQLPFKLPSQEISYPIAHSDGEFYFTIYDKSDYYHLISTISVYRVDSNPSTIKLRTILYKGRTPSEPIFALYSPKDILTFSSTFSNQENFLSDGVQVTTINLKDRRTDPVIKYYPFNKKLLQDGDPLSMQVHLDKRAVRTGDVKVSKCYYRKGSSELHVLMENRFYTAKETSQSNNNNAGSNRNFDANNSNAFMPSQEMERLRGYVINLNNVPGSQAPTNYGGVSPFNNTSTLAGGGAFSNLEQRGSAPPIVAEDGSNQNKAAIPIFDNVSRFDHVELMLDTDKGVISNKKISSRLPAAMEGLYMVTLVLEDKVILINYGDIANSYIRIEHFREGKDPIKKEINLKSGVMPFFQNTMLVVGDDNLIFYYFNTLSNTFGLGRIRL